jgi:hypothetical protein
MLMRKVALAGLYLAPANAKLLLEDTEGRLGGVGPIVTEIVAMSVDEANHA